MYQIQYSKNHGNWIEDLQSDLIYDVEFLKGMLNYLKNSNAINIKVIKLVDVTEEFLR